MIKELERIWMEADMANVWYYPRNSDGVGRIQQAQDRVHKWLLWTQQWTIGFDTKRDVLTTCAAISFSADSEQDPLAGPCEHGSNTFLSDKLKLPLPLFDQTNSWSEI
jgi:hypothetical protein